MVTGSDCLSAAKKDMLSRYPFFGSLAASVKYEETTEIRTIGSNGKTIYSSWSPVVSYTVLY